MTYALLCMNCQALVELLEPRKEHPLKAAEVTISKGKVNSQAHSG